MEEILLYFSLKYAGDFDSILKALECKEKIDEKLKKELFKDITANYTTLISPDYPTALKEIACPPFVLFYYGNLALVKNKCISVIGKRHPSTYGVECTAALAAQLVEAGYTIISGMAMGIDTIAHQSTITANGQTIAVLGSGIELELWTPVGRYLMDTQVSENLQAQWEKAGIHVNIRQWEFQALMSEVKNGGFDMVLLGWSPSTGDADQGLYPVFHSSQFPPNSNRAFYNNPDVDALLDSAKTEVDENARKDMYAEAEKTIMEDAAWTFLYYPKQALSYRSNVSGIEMLPTEHIMLEKVTKQ